MKWALRKAKAPFWYVTNILVACWRFDLRDMAHRKGLHPIKRAAYLSVISAKTIVFSIFLAAMIIVASLSALAFLPWRWVYLELCDTWSDE